MARILRGNIRWADLNPVRGREQAGLRPVLILSHEILMNVREPLLPWLLPVSLNVQDFRLPLT